MSESSIPHCPNCHEPFVDLTPHDRQVLALANNFPWVCYQCFAVSDENGVLLHLESIQEQERGYYMALTQALRTVKTPRTLLEVCEVLRAAFAMGSEVRYAWAMGAPSLLGELWGVMDKIGVAVPDRLSLLLDQQAKPTTEETYIQQVLQAIAVVVRWCEGRIAISTEPADLPPVTTLPPAGCSPATRACRHGLNSTEPLKAYLCDWPSILDALNMDDKEANRVTVRKLDGRYRGPILWPSKGGQPTVEQGSLLRWWNSVAEILEQENERSRLANQREPDLEQYNYGRDGTVVPEIYGTVKRRRKGGDNQKKV